MSKSKQYYLVIETTYAEEDDFDACEREPDETRFETFIAARKAFENSYADEVELYRVVDGKRALYQEHQRNKT